MESDRTIDEDRVYDAAEEFAAATLTDRPAGEGLDRPAWDAAFEFFAANGVIGPLRGESDLRGLHVIKTFEALGRGGADRGLLFALGAHLFGCVIPIARFGTDDQAATWLPGLVNGETVAALAMTESGSGSTVSELTTEAVAADGGYVLSGHKRLITNAPDAGLFLTFAREAGASGRYHFARACSTKRATAAGVVKFSAVRVSGLASNPYLPSRKVTRSRKSIEDHMFSSISRVSASTVIDASSA